ncbi:slipin family protein [Permianibacter aggregans]|uniref:SPFH domain/Band 7 family protein n=1 Tax=Permianibacter aggregans TaxID=1510150 RepID=A0A4R6U671_9GAMM|nr:slipin family protein [Permianibacter aggregans]QGX39851.1 slipin family protein [Permianibacter aggregans]TDQ41741.1 SPFH domain/Band 7 family protein [Permianibacter aggregans]
MLSIKQWKIADNERGLLFKDKQFQRVLAPGRHRLLDVGNRLSVDVVALGQGEVQHAQLDVLIKLPAFIEHVDVQQMANQQVGLVYCDNRLVRLLEPGERAVFWKQPFTIQVQTHDINDGYRIDDKLLSDVLRQGISLGKKGDRLLMAVVPEQSVGLLYENGRLQQTLSAGRHAFWQLNRQLQVQIYDLRLQNVEISGQEILTKDRVSLRINLNAGFRIADPEVVAKKLKQPDDHVYRRLQLALREAVGTRSLDELLADKNLISRVIAKECTDALAQYGIVLEQVGVKDIILPGEMKDILNQVVQAQKAAEANLIKRREETAATRSLHNTAKMMEGNAVLLRLKELETLEKVSERIGQLNVYGGLDSLMNGLVQIGSK